jgi:hypothetical protein
VAGAPAGGAHLACVLDCRNKARRMTITTRFGKKLKVPSTFQVKHQFLLWWLKNQAAKEAKVNGTAETTESAAPMHIHKTLLR